MVAKQLNYDGTRANDGAFTFAVSAQANGYGLEWGKQLTAGTRTDTGATNGTGVAFGYSGEDYLRVTGTSGDYASTPDAAALDITGDIDLRVKVALDDWTPAAESTLIAKYTATGNQRSYALAVTATGALIFRWSEDGTAEKSETSSAALRSAPTSSFFGSPSLMLANTARTRLYSSASLRAWPTTWRFSPMRLASFTILPWNSG